MASNIIYARYGLDDVIIEGITLSMDHCKTHVQPACFENITH